MSKVSKKEQVAAIKAKLGSKDGHPESFVDRSGGKKHHMLRFRDSKSKQEYKGGGYGGMNIHEAMEFEERKRNKQ